MTTQKITPEELRALSRAYPELGEKFRAAADEIERLLSELEDLKFEVLEAMETCHD